jgi:hypothetical protein
MEPQSSRNRTAGYKHGSVVRTFELGTFVVTRKSMALYPKIILIYTLFGYGTDYIINHAVDLLCRPLFQKIDFLQLLSNMLSWGKS